MLLLLRQLPRKIVTRKLCVKTFNIDYITNKFLSYLFIFIWSIFYIWVCDRVCDLLTPRVLVPRPAPVTGKIVVTQGAAWWVHYTLINARFTQLLSFCSPMSLYHIATGKIVIRPCYIKLRRLTQKEIDSHIYSTKELRYIAYKNYIKG